MTRGQRVAESIERSVTGPMWHGPALAELLEGVTPAVAAAKPIAAAHSIWELVLHMASWTEIIRTRIPPGAPPEPTPEMDWPPVTDTSAEAWRSAIEKLKAAKRDLAADVAKLPDDVFTAKVANRDHTVIVMLHGVVEHDAYHGGQIAVLKKSGDRRP